MTEKQETMLDELLDSDSGMSGREIDFIEDLDMHHRESVLTDKQSDWLTAIWERVCNG